MISLDLKTMAVIVIAVSFMLAAITQISRFFLRKASGSEQWALANSSIAIGFSLFIFQGELDKFITIILSNYIIILGLLFLSVGVYHFFGMNSNRKLYITISVLYLILFGYYTYINFHTTNRIVVISTIIAVLFADIAYVIYKNIPTNRHGIYIFNIVIFAILSGYYLLRAILFKMAYYTDRISTEEIVLSISFLMMIFGIVNWTIGLLLMNSVRLENELEENLLSLKEENEARILVEKKLVASNLRLSELSIRDELTGLYNRRYMVDHFKNELANTKRHELYFSVVIIDIDFFKNINDTYGHNVGDEVLVKLSKMFVDFLREVDIVGRYGGEEFMVLLPNTNIDAACELIEQLRKKLEFTNWHNLETNVTFSAGIIEVNSGNCHESPNYLISLADKCLYVAKNSGRNRIEVYRREY